MKEMYFDILNNDNLELIIDSGMLTDSQLDLIYKKLRVLYDLEDNFNAYYDSLSPSEREEDEVNGELFPDEFPFNPTLLLDPVRQTRLISYIIFSGLGVGPLYNDGVDLTDEVVKKWANKIIDLRNL